MFSRRQTTDTLGERGILGDEEQAELVNTIDELRAAVTELKDRVDSQFTTIAAHAEIARQQTELARAEARSDLDRARATIIDLIEQVRLEAVAMHAPGTAPGASHAATNDRLDAIESMVGRLADTVQRCLTRQNELADTMAAFLDTVLAERRGEPVAGLALS